MTAAPYLHVVTLSLEIGLSDVAKGKFYKNYQNI